MRFPSPRTLPPVRAMPARLAGWAVAAVTALAGCQGGEQRKPAPEGVATTTIASVFGRAPDELPALRNPQPPFRYPAALYAQRVQGNVTLRLYVDTAGAVVPDSTRVEESSGHVALDSAALRGARDLRFSPAKRRGTPVAVTLLYPVYFRHPEAEPLPGDSLVAKP